MIIICIFKTSLIFYTYLFIVYIWNISKETIFFLQILMSVNL